jgi:hypothetical protein
LEGFEQRPGRGHHEIAEACVEGPLETSFGETVKSVAVDANDRPCAREEAQRHEAFQRAHALVERRPRRSHAGCWSDGGLAAINIAARHSVGRRISCK